MQVRKNIEKAVVAGKHAFSTTAHKTHSVFKQRLGLGFWIFVVLIFLLGILYFTTFESHIEYVVHEYGYGGIFALSFITDLLVQPIGPDIPLIIGLLVGLNPIVVLIAVLLGSYTTMVIAYYIGKAIGGAGIERLVGHHTYQKIQNSPHYGKWILFLGALTPIPYIPYLAGMWHLSLREVFLYVALPRTVRFIAVCFLSIWFGTTFYDLILI